MAIPVLCQTELTQQALQGSSPQRSSTSQDAKRLIESTLPAGEFLRPKVHCHSTTFGSSHLMKGCFWGYFKRAEVKTIWNSRRFLADFESVPGSQSKTDTAITTVGYNSFLYCSHQCKGVLRFSLVGSVDPSALQGNFRRRPSTDLSALIKRISTMHVHGRSSLLTPDMVPYPRSFLRLPAAATP